MFFDRYKQLCQEKGVSVYKACTDIGLNRSAVNKWKQGGQPNGTTLAGFARYFGVPADRLLEEDSRTGLPGVEAARQVRDLAEELEWLMERLRSDEELTFDGKLLSHEARRSMLTAIQLGMQAAKLEP